MSLVVKFIFLFLLTEVLSESNLFFTQDCQIFCKNGTSSFKQLDRGTISSGPCIDTSRRNAENQQHSVIISGTKISGYHSSAHCNMFLLTWQNATSEYHEILQATCVMGKSSTNNLFITCNKQQRPWCNITTWFTEDNTSANEHMGTMVFFICSFFLAFCFCVIFMYCYWRTRNKLRQCQEHLEGARNALIQIDGDFGGFCNNSPRTRVMGANNNRSGGYREQFELMRVGSGNVPLDLPPSYEESLQQML